jgi:hypothetical protein
MQFRQFLGGQQKVRRSGCVKEPPRKQTKRADPTWKPSPRVKKDSKDQMTPSARVASATLMNPAMFAPAT